MINNWNPILLGCLLFCVSACDGRQAAPVTVTDSAGVRITLTPDNSLIFAEIDTLPELSIGGAAAADAARFFRIQSIHVDSRGRLWVADGQSGELRIFRPDGSHWKTRGGRGEGPGEFVQIRLLGAFHGDSVLIGDAGTGRVTVFDPEGEFVRSERLLASESPAPRPFGVFRDGSVLGQVPRIIAATSLVPGQILGDSVELVRVTPATSTVEHYGTAPGPLWLWTGRNQVPVPFTVNASFDIVGEAVHLVSGPDCRIRVFEDGQVREVYGVDRARRGVTDDDVGSYRELVADYIPEAIRADYLSGLNHERRPSVLPAYDRVLAAPRGHVWAQIYESDHRAAHDWDVYDEQRRFVGRVRLPGGFQPMVITEDAVVGVWRDELDVEHVRSYRLVPVSATAGRIGMSDDAWTNSGRSFAAVRTSLRHVHPAQSSDGQQHERAEHQNGRRDRDA